MWDVHGFLDSLTYLLRQIPISLLDLLLGHFLWLGSWHLWCVLHRKELLDHIRSTSVCFLDPFHIVGKDLLLTFLCVGKNNILVYCKLIVFLWFAFFVFFMRGKVTIHLISGDCLDACVTFSKQQTKNVLTQGHFQLRHQIEWGILVCSQTQCLYSFLAQFPCNYHFHAIYATEFSPTSWRHVCRVLSTVHLEHLLLSLEHR